MLDLPGLNAERADDRLQALRAFAHQHGKRRPPSTGIPEVNCHVHTFYSFSPYSPASAALHAREAGLVAVGIMDHDSMAGAAEIRESGKILGVATTQGVEIRVSAAGTSLERRRMNNPDSLGILYMSIHGVPARGVARVREFLRPLQAAREARGRRMAEALGSLLPRYGLRPLDWDRDVRAWSRAAEGGTITERHLLHAVATVIVEKAGTGEPLLRFLEQEIGIRPPARVAGYLRDPSNTMLVFDLLGLLKSSFLEKVYIQPGPDECVPARRVIQLAEEVGGIPTYPYLGDVTDSPTGDKKAERFEDSYLEELMDEVRRLGFRAIAYMPPRNTREQLLRLQRLCAERGFMEISGVDINSPRQSFNCPELQQPEFSHLISATWALIAHERLSDEEPRLGLFHPDNPLAGRPLAERIAAYAEVGSARDPSDERPALEHPRAAALKRLAGR